MSRSWLVGVAVVAQVLVAQEEPTGAKSALHNPADAALAPILYQVDLRDKEGRFTTVTEGHKFKSHDKIRLRLKANVAGVVTVLTRDAGKAIKLFPADPAESLAVSSEQEITVFLTFDDKPDDVELIVVLAKIPGAAQEWVDKINKSSKFATQLIALAQTGSKGIAADKDQTGGSAASDSSLDVKVRGVVAQRVKLSHAK